MGLRQKLTVLLLMAMVYIAFSVPTSADSSCTVSACQPVTAWSKTLPASVNLAKQMAPSSYQYKNKANLQNEMNLTKANVNGYVMTNFGARMLPTFPGAVAYKTLSRYPNGTWHITISFTQPAGYRAVVTDYLFNLRPIPGSFNMNPAVNFGYYLEWHIPANPTARTVTITFNARQQVPGFVGDQGVIYYYYGSVPLPLGVTWTAPVIV